MHTALASAEPESVITITQSEIDSMRTKNPNSASLIVFGCPHLTCKEASEIAAWLGGRSLKTNVWLCLMPQAKSDFEKTRCFKELDTDHVAVHSHCPLSALTVQLRRQKVLTTSGKLFYYLDGAEYGTIEDSICACVT